MTDSRRSTVRCKTHRPLPLPLPALMTSRCDPTRFKKRIQNLLRRLFDAEKDSGLTWLCEVSKRQAAQGALVESGGHAGNAYLALERLLK